VRQADGMSRKGVHDDPDTPQRAQQASAAHYLEDELYRLVREDPAIFDFLQDGSLDGLWYWDLEAPEHEWMSPRFWQVLGYDPGAMPHRAEAWQDMIHPDDLALARENLKRHCDDPTHPYDQVVRYRHRDGSTVWVRCRGIAIRDSRGKPMRMLGAHTDLTAVKEREAELQEKTEELERSNAELDQFASVASHDLQEPLRMISSYLQLIERRYKDRLDDTADEFIRYAVDGAQRMQRLINDLLVYSRVGTIEKKLVPVDCEVIFEEALVNLAIALEEADGRVTHDALPTVVVDDVQLGQLLQNLIGNAIKFRGAQPPLVHVSAELAGEEWVFSVRDNGIGIQADSAERLFQLFERYHARAEYPGTGIGLAVCRKIVERHGGRIWVTSEPGHGATFCFTIPAASPPRWAGHSSRPAHASGPAR